VWGRSLDKARNLVEILRQHSNAPSVHVVEALEAEVREADVISCVTAASDPVVFGDWLKPGAFLDLVGSHTPERRECDDQAVSRARIYVDTLEGALAEAGDLLIPLQMGTIEQANIVGDLHGLCRGSVPGRGTPDEIILFKSVGTALEDLAAAQLVMTRE
jgi:ornithine cyclodeaminase